MYSKVTELSIAHAYVTQQLMRYLVQALNILNGAID